MPATQPTELTLFRHRSVEYFTPSIYIDAAREVMGGIDLDPASCEEAQQTVKAKWWYGGTEVDGLSQPWYLPHPDGRITPLRVWLNPPYCKTGCRSNQDIWYRKLYGAYICGHVSEAIMLVKAALGYKWFEQLWRRHWCCFCRERIAFIKPGGRTVGLAKQGSVFVYFGKRPERFAEVFARFGRLVPPEAFHGD